LSANQLILYVVLGFVGLLLIMCLALGVVIVLLCRKRRLGHRFSGMYYYMLIQLCHCVVLIVLTARKLAIYRYGMCMYRSGLADAMIPILYVRYI